MEQSLFLGIFISFIYSLVVLGILQQIIFRKLSNRIYLTYIFYVSLAIIYYSLNLSILPEFKGFTGGFRVGTDDCRFFSQIVDVKFNLPNHCYALTQKHLFSVFIDFVFPFKVYHPLQIIIFNVIGITFIPFLGEKIYFYFFRSENDKQKVVFYLLLLSPTILANGLIFMREGWTVQFFLIFIYCLLYGKNKIMLLVSFVLLILLRPSFIVFPVLFYLLNKYYGKKNFYLRIFFSTIAVIPIFGYILNVSEGINILEGIIRLGYIDSFLSEFGEKSIFFKIMKLPFPINTIISFVFFFLSPFLILNFYYYDAFIIRNVFSLVEAIIMLILTPVSLVNIFNNWHSSNKNNKKLLLIVCVSIFILAIFSLQFRHKIIILPLLYMLLIHNFNLKKGYLLFISIYLLIQLFIIF